MPAGGGNFQCPLGVLLAFDVRKIYLIFQALIENIVDINFKWLEHISILEKLHRLFQILHRIHFHPAGSSGFPGVIFGEDKSFEPVLGGGQRHRQSAVNGTQRAVQREFPQNHKLFIFFSGYLPGGGQYPNGYGEVEGGADLFDVRRSQIDDYFFIREGEAGVFNGGLNSLLGFPHCIVGQTDDGKGRQHREQIGLYFHAVSVYSQDGGRYDFGEHKVVMELLIKIPRRSCGVKPKGAFIPLLFLQPSGDFFLQVFVYNLGESQFVGIQNCIQFLFFEQLFFQHYFLQTLLVL